MKHTLGKLLILFLLLHLPLCAKDNLATYTLTSSKKIIHIKEPLLITFKAEQKNHKDHMFFSFNIEQSPDYEVKLLNKSIEDKGYHNTITTFKFILFALKEKTLHIKPNFIIHTASDKAVKQSYVDDHDDSIATQTYDTPITLKPMNIKVEQFKKHVDLVGDFRLNSSIDRTNIEPYGAVNVHYTLSGQGYKESTFTVLDKQINNVNIFSKKKDNNSRLVKDGYIINIQYIYALSAKNDFTIPARTFNVYSPTTNSYYTLHAQAYTIKVKKIDSTLLVDKTDNPKEESFISLAKIKDLFIYLLVFLSGFVAAKLSEKSFMHRKQKEEFKDIKEAKTAKELLLILIIHYQNRGLDIESSKLEADTHAKSPIKLNKIKKEILKKLT